MKAVPSDASAWTPRRWSLLILAVFLAHVGLIWAFSDHRPLPLRPPAPAPLLALAPAENELLALNDPTLFALPHRRGFSGQAWLKPTKVTIAPFRWSEPARLLQLRAETLGAVFQQYMQTNRFVSLTFESKPRPEFEPPVAGEIGAPAPTNSVLLVTGALAQRRLLNPPELSAYRAPDLLTNTVAQILVKPDGQVFSATLLNSSMSKEADQRALDIARTARFEPLPQPAASLMSGNLIFIWYTEPPLPEAKPAP